MHHIAVDFDGTIVDHCFPEIGDPVPGAIYWLKKFKSLQVNLILWTMRSDGQAHGDVLTQAINYLADNGVIVDHANSHPQNWTTSQKAYANVYIDDAAYGCPMLERVGKSGRKMVDWSVVGPDVYRQIVQSRLETTNPEDTEQQIAYNKLLSELEDLLTDKTWF